MAAVSFAHAAPGEPGRWQVLRLAALSVPIYAAAQPVMAFVPAILSRHYGIGLASLGLVFLIGQAVNALLDPLVGALSDRTASRFGRRRPWVAGGGVLFLFGSALLFFPPAGVGIGWVAAGAFLYFCGSSIATTALLAWSGEISGDYRRRTAIASLFTFLSAAALVLALLLPAIADRVRPGDGPLRLTLFGALVLATGLPGLWLTLTAVPDPAAPAVRTRPGLRAALRAVFADRQLLRVLAADTLVTSGQGVRTALLLFVVTLYLGRPEWAGALFLFQYSFGLLAAPIWQRIGRTLGKARAAVLAELAQAAINLGLLALTPDRFGLMLALAAAQGLTQGAGNLMLRAMVADLADAARADSGEERGGLFYSAFSISAKLGGALALGLALPLLGALGFDPHGANGPAALHALLLVFALGPALGHAAAAALLTGFPLDEAAHSEIRARLTARDAALVPAE
ncbi:MAG: MFS transporter [Sphingomonadales bacterium]|nr:MFS transporter [Sphingomonadales bacterium]